MKLKLAIILFSFFLSGNAHASFLGCIKSFIGIGTLKSDPRVPSSDPKELFANLSRYKPEKLNIFDVPELKAQFDLFETWVTKEIEFKESLLDGGDEKVKKTLSQVLTAIQKAKRDGSLSYKDSLSLIRKALLTQISTSVRVESSPFSLDSSQKYLFIFQDELISEYDLLKHHLNNIYILQVPFKETSTVHNLSLPPLYVAIHDLDHSYPNSNPNPKWKGQPPDTQAILNLLERAKEIKDEDLSKRVISCIFQLAHEQISYKSPIEKDQKWQVSPKIAEWKWLFSHESDTWIRNPAHSIFNTEPQHIRMKLSTMETMLLSNFERQFNGSETSGHKISEIQAYRKAIQWLKENL